MKVEIWSDNGCLWRDIVKRCFESAPARFARREDVEVSAGHSLRRTPARPVVDHGPGVVPREPRWPRKRPNEMRLVAKNIGVSALLLGLLAACATPESGGGVAKPPSPPTPATVLTIALQASKTAPAQSWTLFCQPTGGTLPNAAQVCAYVAKAPAEVLAPVPPGQACSQIYGGPQVATISGTWRGKRVDARLARNNGCEIARWDKVKTLIGDAGN